MLADARASCFLTTARSQCFDKYYKTYLQLQHRREWFAVCLQEQFHEPWPGFSVVMLVVFNRSKAPFLTKFYHLNHCKLFKLFETLLLSAGYFVQFVATSTSTNDAFAKMALKHNCQ